MALKANASPTKAFFVRMLTRDITLTDCILDLVDNCVDGAWNHAGSKPSTFAPSDELSQYWVAITTTSDKFIIEDNCGGISLDEAVEYAFTFGRKPEQPTHEFNIGVYGIGMKRAAFKIGNDIRITSTYADTDGGGQLRTFIVRIDVARWLADKGDDWDFDIEEADARDTAGVRIEIDGLANGVAAQFESPEFAHNLWQTLGRDYLLPAMRGMKISLNDRPVQGRVPMVRSGGPVEAMRAVYQDGEVRVEIFAGMSASPPDDSGPEPESRTDVTSGWYVLCNGRAVVSADRSELTGWGLGTPRWHSQYGGFIGVVLFTSSRPDALPTTTTKRSLDTSSPVYLRALAQMREPTRAWTTYTNTRKRDIDGAKLIEQLAPAVPLSELPTRASVRLPDVNTPSNTPEMANVTYAVELRRLRALASAFGSRSMSYRTVGARSFEYAFDQLVDEDDS